MNFKINEMKKEDLNAVLKIYMEGIKTGKATFQTDGKTPEEWENEHLKICRLVAKSNEAVLGWIALTPTSSRCVYKGVAEVSIYIGEEFRGYGVGKALLNKLIEVSEQNNIWTLQSSIIIDNKESLDLHKRCGFREIGIREKVAKLNGKWTDVVLVERRSKVIGIN